VADAEIVLRKEEFDQMANSNNYELRRTVSCLLVINHMKGREVKWNSQEQQTVLIGPEHLIQRLEDYLQ
jgi:hypothetical protein